MWPDLAYIRFWKKAKLIYRLLTLLEALNTLAIDDLCKALIYSSSNSTYELFQNITLSSDTSLRSHGGAYTDDHEWILSIDNQIKVFNFNSSIDEFTLTHIVV